MHGRLPRKQHFTCCIHDVLQMDFVFDENIICRTPGHDWSSSSDEEPQAAPVVPLPAPATTKAYSCQVPLCNGKTFSQCRQLVKHHNSVHRPTLLLHACNQCSVKSINKRDIVRHQRKNHGGQVEIFSAKVRNKKYLSPQQVPTPKTCNQYCMETNLEQEEFTRREASAAATSRRMEAEEEERRCFKELCKTEADLWKQKATEYKNKWLAEKKKRQRAEQHLAKLKRQ